MNIGKVEIIESLIIESLIIESRGTQDEQKEGG